MPATDSDIEELEASAEVRGISSEKDARSSSGQGGSARRQSTPRTASLEKRLAQTFGAIGMVVATFDPVCGQTVLERAPVLADTWNRLAQQDPKVKKVLESLLQGGMYGEALFVTAITILPILKHHNLLPGNVEIEGLETPPSDDRNTTFEADVQDIREAETPEQILKV